MSGRRRRDSIAGGAREFIARTIVAWHNSPEERRRRQDELGKGVKRILADQGDVPTELDAFWRWLAWMKGHADRTTADHPTLLPEGLITVGVSRFIVGIGDWLVAYRLASEAITLQMTVDELAAKQDAES